MGLLNDIREIQNAVNTIETPKDKFKRELAVLEPMKPSQRRVLQEYFEPGFGIEQKVGCFAKQPEIKTMSASEYREIVKQEVTGLTIKKKAISKLGIDEDQVKEIQPVEFRGFIFPRGEHFYKSGCSNLYEVTWLFFSADQLYVYSLTFDMLSDSKKERTEEYFYKDVTNFSSATDSEETVEMVVSEVKAKGCGCMKKPPKKEYKQLKTMLETAKFSIIVPGDKFSCAMEASDDLESRIQGMKQKLREKKT
ncbi:MAG: hypothetical protein LBC73_03230 [Oscillospiraceae bacterium]|jgi:hypothetical protein|nr:hypothetical protein [Oscillospiraceae bacterium]